MLLTLLKIKNLSDAWTTKLFSGNEISEEALVSTRATLEFISAYNIKIK